MLEMIKTDEIVFRQSELFGPIWIYRKKNNADYAEEMAHETVFFSKDPDVKPGLVEAIRNQALARSKEQSVGDLAAVMREAVLWTSRGRNVTEDDLTAMLEGREDLSEVQENPFAEMMKEDDAADGSTPSTNSTGSSTLSGTESPTDSAPVVEETVVSGEAPVESSWKDEGLTGSTPEVPIETASKSEEWIASPEARNDVSEEPVDVSIESIDETPAEEPQSSDSSNNEPNMTDEEFEAFMKKAQAFYDSQASENSDDSDSSDDDDDFPSIEVHTND
jgi:hypothetical protein